MKILIIEDNEILRENIKKYFEIQGFICDTHDSYTGASYKITTGSYDIIVLDLGLGEGEHDGLDICEEVRNKGITIPILMLTARTLTQQKIEGLRIGADDYMTKPFDYGELLARVEALCRREKKHKGNFLTYKDISINKESFEVTQNNLSIQLSKLEYRLLLFLLENRGMVLKKEQILEKVWGDIDLFENTRKLDIYVGYLRKKLGNELIQTVHGVGYIIS